MIKTALKTCAVAAVISGTGFLAAGPALAGTHDNNHGQANNNTVYVMFVGGYGVNCGSVSMASNNTSTGCNGNKIKAGDIEDY